LEFRSEQLYFRTDAGRGLKNKWRRAGQKKGSLEGLAFGFHGQTLNGIQERPLIPTIRSGGPLQGGERGPGGPESLDGSGSINNINVDINNFK